MFLVWAHSGVHHSQHKVSFIFVISKSRPSCYKPSFSNLRRTLGECFLTVGLSFGRTFLTLRNRVWTWDSGRGSTGSCFRKPLSNNIVFCFQSLGSFRTTVENNWDAQQTAAPLSRSLNFKPGAADRKSFREFESESDWIPNALAITSLRICYR